MKSCLFHFSTPVGGRRNRRALRWAAGLAVAAALLTSAGLAQAQYVDNSDHLLLGFTTPSSTGDLVIDLGSATGVGVGGTNVVDLIANGNVGMTASDFVGEIDSLYGSFDLVSWGVVGGFYKNASTALIYATVPHNSGRPSPANSFGFASTAINTVGASIDGSGTPANQMVTDPTQGYGNSWSEEIAPGGAGVRDTFVIDYLNPNQTTPSSFEATLNYQQADLYFSSPTNTTATLAGTFTLGSDGSFTFTPAVASTPVPPPAPELSLQRAGASYAISFGSTNGATYSLYYTNIAGITRPTTNWAVSSTVLTGNGATMTFTNTSTDPNRVYRVLAQ